MVKFQKQITKQQGICRICPVAVIGIVAIISAAGLLVLQSSFVGESGISAIDALWAEIHASAVPVSDQSKPKLDAEYVTDTADEQVSSASAAAASTMAVNVPLQQQQKSQIDKSIPHHLFFPFDEKNVEAQDVNDRAAKKRRLGFIHSNIDNTVKLYREEFRRQNDDNVLAMSTVLDNETCRSEVARAKTALVQYYDNEERVKIKYDLCRISALFNHGGYALDVEVRMLRPLVLDESIKFAIVSSPSGKSFLQSWLATTQHHPVMAESLDLFLDFYEGRATNKHLKKGGPNTGKIIIKFAFDSVQSSLPSFDLVGQSRFLRELDLRRSPHMYSDLQRQVGKGCCCHYVGHDRDTKQVYFFSKMAGITPFCELDPTGTANDAAASVATTNAAAANSSGQNVVSGKLLAKKRANR